MATEAHRRTWRSTVERARDEREGAERNELREGEIRGARTAPSDRPGPLQFDALGFPIPQPIPAFVQRVRRLIDGD
jgi:hypothetical protein